MHFVDANNAEVKKKWDALVVSQQASIFSQSAYLDAVSNSWMILYDAHEKSGIACPYVVKAGIKILVTPFYFRYVEWIGEPVNHNKLVTTLLQMFPVCSLQLKESFGGEKKVYQVVEPNKLKLNNLAKRSLKKASAFEVTQELNIPQLFLLIERELFPKIEGIDSNTLPFLRQLIEKYSTSLLIQLNIYDGAQWCGGIWLFETEKVVYYIKGATTPEAKKNGGMYRLLMQGISLAHEKGKTFDFGGSNAPSVKRFNMNFGAEDQFYSELNWNKAPFWWNVLRKFKGLLRR